MPLLTVCLKRDFSEWYPNDKSKKFSLWIKENFVSKFYFPLQSFLNPYPLLEKATINAKI